MLKWLHYDESHLKTYPDIKGFESLTPLKFRELSCY
jgi:hypothetical protein